MKKTIASIVTALLAASSAQSTQIFAYANEDFFEVEIVRPGTASAVFTQVFNAVPVVVDVDQGVDQFAVNVYWGRNEGLGGVGPVSDTFTVSSPYAAANVVGFDGVVVRDGFRGLFLRYGYRDFTAPDSGSTMLCTLGGLLGVAAFARRRVAQ